MIKNLVEKTGKLLETNKVSGIIIALVAFAAVIAVSFTNGYKRFELNLYDINFSIKPKIAEWDRLCFVDIDDNSTDTLGQFPWPRYMYGRAMTAMAESGVSLSAFDIMFPNASSLQVSEEAYKRFLNKVEKKTEIQTDEIKQIIIDNDRLFSEGLTYMENAILAYNMAPELPVADVEDMRSTDEFKKALEYFNQVATQEIPESEYKKYETITDNTTRSISYPIPTLMSSAKNFGFVNRDTDIDGAVRKVRLVQFFDGRLYFNLALVMLMDACGLTVNDIQVEPGKEIVLKGAINPKTQKKEDLKIPIDESGMLYVNWAGEGKREDTFKVLPFYALVEFQDFVQPVYDLFDEIGGKDGIKQRDKIHDELLRARQEFALAQTDDERIAARKNILNLMQQDRKIKDEYAEVISTEIKNLEEEFKATNNPLLQGDIAVLQNELNAIDLVLSVESLQDNIAITGLTATGTVDIGQTPTSNEYALVGAYHNTINTIIQGQFIYMAPKWINYALMLAIAIFMGFTIQRLNARMSVFTIIISFFIVNAITAGIFTLGDIWLDELGASLALLVPSAAIASVKFMREESQKHFIKSAFAHYLSPGVIDRIIENPDSLELGGVERELTMFFSDVQGFSSISEKLTPPELVALLNEYLSEMTDIILKNGGTVDKYEGDAIIAFFGAPQPFEDHALRCCIAAIEQQKRLAEMQKVWAAEGRHVLKVRMGINTGVAVVGNMGSRTRFDYTVMGDSVNLASRLEGANKAYGTFCMISGATYEAVKNDVEVRRLDVIRVVGKKEPVPVYELMDVKGGLSKVARNLRDTYSKGLELFTDRQWVAAKKEFLAALKIVPEDGPSKTYIERCNAYIKTPPPKDWDGVFGLTSK